MPCSDRSNKANRRVRETSYQAHSLQTPTQWGTIFKITCVAFKEHHRLLSMHRERRCTWHNQMFQFLSAVSDSKHTAFRRKKTMYWLKLLYIFSWENRKGFRPLVWVERNCECTAGLQVTLPQCSCTVLDLTLICVSLNSCRIHLCQELCNRSCIEDVLLHCSSWTVRAN